MQDAWRDGPLTAAEWLVITSRQQTAPHDAVTSSGEQGDGVCQPKSDGQTTISD